MTWRPGGREAEREREADREGAKDGRSKRERESQTLATDPPSFSLLAPIANRELETDRERES